jgi:putative transposase
MADLVAAARTFIWSYMAVEYPLKLSIAALVNGGKGTSSRLLRKNDAHIASRYGKGLLSAPRYLAASTGGAPLTTLPHYVEHQRAASPP